MIGKRKGREPRGWRERGGFSFGLGERVGWKYKRSRLFQGPVRIKSRGAEKL